MGPTGPKGATGAAGVGAGLFGQDTSSARKGAPDVPQCVVGEMILTASRIAGRGLLANGQIVAIADYPALFNALGTTYGGDGTTNFALPDMRAITPNHMTYFICPQGAFVSPE